MRSSPKKLNPQHVPIVAQVMPTVQIIVIVKNDHDGPANCFNFPKLAVWFLYIVNPVAR